MALSKRRTIKVDDYEREREEALACESLSQGAYNRLAVNQYAAAHGEDSPDQAWILSPFDSWEPNPFYRGPPVPHPEEYDYDEEGA